MDVPLIVDSNNDPIVYANKCTVWEKRVKSRSHKRKTSKGKQRVPASKSAKDIASDSDESDDEQADLDDLRERTDSDSDSDKQQRTTIVRTECSVKKLEVRC